MKKIRLLFTTIMLVAFNALIHSQGCASGSGDLIGVTGFIQPQYNYNINGNGNDTHNFTFNRARLGVMGSIPYDIDYYVMLEFSPYKTPQKTPHLLDAFVSYTRFSKWAKLSLGQFKSPFSLEQNTACSGLYTVNRSEAVNQLAGPQRDLGLLISGGHDSLLVQYSLGIMNGTGMNVEDDNNNKEIVGRLVFNPFEGLKIGGSFKYGTINPTDLAQKQNEIYRFAGEIQYKIGGLLLQSEYIHGIDQLHSASKLPVYGGCGGIVGYETKATGSYAKSGLWAMASYMTPWNLEPVVKFDTYNSDHGVAGKRTNYTTIGMNYYVNDYSRIQINYVNVQESAAITNDMIMVQVQARF
jgi:phosphate-selective porin OprO and OprP